MKNRTMSSLYDAARRGLAEGDAGYWKAAEAMAALSDTGDRAHDRGQTEL